MFGRIRRIVRKPTRQGDEYMEDAPLVETKSYEETRFEILGAPRRVARRDY